MPPLIRAEGLTKRYGNTIALDAIDLEIHEGITGLLGANGAGKSTAIKLFLGLLKPTAGSVWVLGQDPSRSVEVRARLGYMPEHDCLPATASAAELVYHMAQVSGLPPAHARTRAADALRHVGLDEERYRPMGEYSTGMKQRVKLAQAIVHDPALVFLDEPTAGLDPVGREEMLQLIKRIGKEFGISILLSSHLMGDVERTCDRIIVLDGGRVIREGGISGFTSETEAIFIEVDSNREDLVTALAARGINAALLDGAVVVEGASEEQYDTIRDAIVDAGARLRRLAPGRHMLTDIFRSTPS